MGMQHAMPQVLLAPPPGMGDSTAMMAQQKIANKRLSQIQNQFTKKVPPMEKMFKKLGLDVSLKGMLKQSQIFTGTLGAIFQILGAFIDITLAPMLPMIVPFIRKMVKMIPWFKKLGESIRDTIMFIHKWTEKLLPKFMKGWSKWILAGLALLTIIALKSGLMGMGLKKGGGALGRKIFQRGASKGPMAGLSQVGTQQASTKLAGNIATNAANTSILTRMAFWKKAVPIATLTTSGSSVAFDGKGGTPPEVTLKDADVKIEKPKVVVDPVEIEKKKVILNDTPEPLRTSPTGPEGSSRTFRSTYEPSAGRFKTPGGGGYRGGGPTKTPDTPLMRSRPGGDFIEIYKSGMAKQAEVMKDIPTRFTRVTTEVKLELDAVSTKMSSLAEAAEAFLEGDGVRAAPQTAEDLAKLNQAMEDSARAIKHQDALEKGRQNIRSKGDPDLFFMRMTDEATTVVRKTTAKFNEITEKFGSTDIDQMRSTQQAGGGKAYLDAIEKQKLKQQGMPNFDDIPWRKALREQNAADKLKPKGFGQTTMRGVKGAANIMGWTDVVFDTANNLAQTKEMIESYEAHTGESMAMWKKVVLYSEDGLQLIKDAALASGKTGALVAGVAAAGPTGGGSLIGMAATIAALEAVDTGLQIVGNELGNVVAGSYNTPLYAQPSSAEGMKQGFMEYLQKINPVTAFTKDPKKDYADYVPQYNEEGKLRSSATGTLESGGYIEMLEMASLAPGAIGDFGQSVSKWNDDFNIVNSTFGDGVEKLQADVDEGFKPITLVLEEYAEAEKAAQVAIRAAAVEAENAALAFKGIPGMMEDMWGASSPVSKEVVAAWVAPATSVSKAIETNSAAVRSSVIAQNNAFKVTTSDPDPTIVPVEDNTVATKDLTATVVELVEVIKVVATGNPADYGRMIGLPRSFT